MGYKNVDWNKVEAPFPIDRVDKGEIKITPLHQAFGNAKQVVAPRLKIQPIPTQGIVGEE